MLAWQDAEAHQASMKDIELKQQQEIEAEQRRRRMLEEHEGGPDKQVEGRRKRWLFW
jgi:hypothetical protein